MTSATRLVLSRSRRLTVCPDQLSKDAGAAPWKRDERSHACMNKDWKVSAQSSWKCHETDAGKPSSRSIRRCESPEDRCSKVGPAPVRYRAVHLRSGA